MARELTMPRLSDSMEEATIIRWLRRPGEAFAKGDPLVEIETDKATIVFEAEMDGVLAAILVEEGHSAVLGAPIARVDGEDGERGPFEATHATTTAPPPARTARSPSATPIARRKALELGVSLDGLVGTGPAGRITRRDVERARGEGTYSRLAGSVGSGAGTEVPLSPTQRTIARRMVKSAMSIPAFSVTAEIDMSPVVRLRDEARDRRQVFSLNAFVVKAAAATLRKFPRFNASYKDDVVTLHRRVNIGIAVAADEALLVPTIFDADRKSLREIASECRRLADAGRKRALTTDELTQGTFTVSNLGMLGIRSFTAIIQVPQVAILAAGEIARRPVEGARGEVFFREEMAVTLTCDHRVVYGADAAHFLNHLRELLERPLALAF